jgi:hypothetical protein
MDAPGRITFTYGFADYLALNRLMRRDSLWKRTQFIRVPLAVALAVAAIIAIHAAMNGRSVGQALGQLPVMWEFWVLIAAILPLVLFLNRLELGVYYRRQRIDGQAISISFDDEKGITSEGPSGTGVIAWNGVRKLVSDADVHVILYENRMIGLCLPRRAFASQQAFDDLARYVEARIASGRAA